MSVSHTPGTQTHGHAELSFLRKYIFSEDHKIIGIQFLFSGLIFLLIGGLLAMLVRIQLGWPHATIPILGKAWFPASAGDRMDPSFYNMLFSMHATIMIFFVIIPMLGGAFGNFTIPLMVGAKEDRKSTRLNSSHGSISYAVFCLKKKNSATWGWRRSSRR